MDIIAELVESDTVSVVDAVEPVVESVVESAVAPEQKRLGRPKGAPNRAKAMEPVVVLETIRPVVIEAPRARAKRAARAASVIAPTVAPAPPAPPAPSFDDLLGHLGRMLAEQKNARTETRREMYRSFLE